MSYKIAVASSDGVHIDESFGAADVFHIYQAEGTRFSLLEDRAVPSEPSPDSGSCGCGSGSGNCSGGSEKIAALADVRAVVAAKVGFRAQKELEKRAISIFDLSAEITPVLTKITAYYDRIDRHKSLI